MENQNIQWANWEEQPQETNEQSQINWGEQPQEENIPTWGEQPQQEQPQINEEDSFSTHESHIEELNIPEWELKTSLLGLFPKLKIESLIYKVDYNNAQVTQDLLNGGFDSVNNDGMYKLKPQPGSELNKVLFAIKNIAETRGMKVQHSFLYKNSHNESVINMSRGNCRYNYIYFAQASHNSGDIVLDLSAIDGPSEQLLEASSGLLLLLPGWVPYRITKNTSNEDMIAIAGRLIL